jgi:hypothetical protein
MDATYAPGMDPVYQTTAQSINGQDQFSLQPSASQGKSLNAFLVSLEHLGHIAGAFARHRFDLKTQLQQQAAAAAAAAAAGTGNGNQQLPTDKLNTKVSRGEATNSTVQQLVHQMQHQPHLSANNPRPTTSINALR